MRFSTVWKINEPDVQCIAKGKEHKKYEFGNKVAIAYTQKMGVIVGAMSFRNPYDGHTLDTVLDQHEALTGTRAATATGDRGYRGSKQIGGTRIQVPGAFGKKLNRYKRDKLRKAFRHRAAIEPVIGHLKSDHRLGRNFLKGVTGDAINLLLAAAAFNFKRIMNKWKRLLSIFLSAFLRLTHSNDTHLNTQAA
jgi:IS5 family transposase